MFIRDCYIRDTSDNFCHVDLIDQRFPSICLPIQHQKAKQPVVIDSQTPEKYESEVSTSILSLNIDEETEIISVRFVVTLSPTFLFNHLYVLVFSFSQVVAAKTTHLQ